MIEQILWVILPYIVITIFIGGHIYRYQHDQFGWTAKSSEMLEKKKLALGSSLFHWGIFFVIGGHVMGILIPESLYEALGVSEHMYHKIAIGFGLPAGIAALSGLLILTYRRFTDKRIRKTRLCRRFNHPCRFVIRDDHWACGNLLKHRFKRIRLQDNNRPVVSQHFLIQAGCRAYGERAPLV